ncbi:MAG: Rrf2 family transcriptional regulator [Deltaproteobacteria bacterium]|nr:Rrf2 family transcriptional regulator [Deltaproteobacteria bacterium]
MRVSQKTDYAVRALVDLALNAREGAPARLSEIARRGSIPEKFLEAILVELRRAGLVKSRRGPEGGHRLARPPGQITLGQIRAAMDGPLSLVEPPSRRQAAAPLHAGLQPMWKEVEMAIGTVLDGVTVEDMCRRVEVNSAMPDFSI